MLSNVFINIYALIMTLRNFLDFVLSCKHLPQAERIEKKTVFLVFLKNPYEF